MSKPQTNDSLVRQIRERNRLRLEANATRAAVAVVRLLPASQRTMKRATAIQAAILEEFTDSLGEVRP